VFVFVGCENEKEGYSEMKLQLGLNYCGWTRYYCTNGILEHFDGGSTFRYMSKENEMCLASFQSLSLSGSLSPDKNIDLSLFPFTTSFYSKGPSSKTFSETNAVFSRPRRHFSKLKRQENVYCTK